MKAYSNPIPSPASLNKPIAHVIPSTGSRITRPRTTRLRENRRHSPQSLVGTYVERSSDYVDERGEEISKGWRKKKRDTLQ